jgi:ABC-type sugar transport system permease subunit
MTLVTAPSDVTTARTTPRAARRRAGSPVWYGFVLPPLLLLLLFVVYPTLETFRQSVYTQDRAQERFVGIDKYAQLYTNGIFWGALANTLLLGVAFLAIVIPMSAVLASMLNRLRRGSTPFKVIYFLPQMTSSVAIALIFQYVFQPDWGLFNGVLRALGVENLPLWLSEPRFSLTGSRAAVTLLAVWAALGYFMLIVLAGLQNISAELYEAAALDGANAVQIWWRITIPSLRPTLVFLVITGTIDAMSRFSDLWMLGGPGGSPARSLQTVVMYMFQTGFESGDRNLAAAIAVTFFLLMLGVTALSFRTLLAEEFHAIRARRAVRRGGGS